MWPSRAYCKIVLTHRLWVLSILTCKQVLCTPFADQNYLFGLIFCAFSSFSHLGRKKMEKLDEMQKKMILASKQQWTACDEAPVYWSKYTTCERKLFCCDEKNSFQRSFQLFFSSQQNLCCLEETRSSLCCDFFEKNASHTKHKMVWRKLFLLLLFMFVHTSMFVAQDRKYG